MIVTNSDASSPDANSINATQPPPSTLVSSNVQPAPPVDSSFAVPRFLSQKEDAHFSTAGRSAAGGSPVTRTRLHSRKRLSRNASRYSLQPGHRSFFSASSTCNTTRPFSATSSQPRQETARVHARHPSVCTGSPWGVLIRFGCSAPHLPRAPFVAFFPERRHGKTQASVPLHKAALRQFTVDMHERGSWKASAIAATSMRAQAAAKSSLALVLHVAKHHRCTG